MTSGTAALKTLLRLKLNHFSLAIDDFAEVTTQLHRTLREKVLLVSNVR
ncbi:MAG: hypothetical protein IV112_18630 [Methyloversatilis discipulorum]|nr:hypothetical protein [Methyloversatilis discipulorum]MBT9518705.1 hypothetical protein [Methyloversatilis discipulorum]